jgi:hypothetical protein
LEEGAKPSYAKASEGEEGLKDLLDFFVFASISSLISLKAGGLKGQIILAQAAPWVLGSITERPERLA